MKRLLVTLCLLLLPWAAQAQVGTPTTLGNVCQNSTGVNTLNISTTGNITAGNTVVVVFNTLAGFVSGGVFSISDGTANVYHLVEQTTIGGASASDFEVWESITSNSVSASTNITISLNSPNLGSMQAAAAQVSGVSSVDNASASAEGHSASPSVTTGTLASSNAVVFDATGFDNFGGITYTESSAFTNLYNNLPCSTNSGLSLGYQLVSSTSAVTAAPLLSGSQVWGIVAGVFDGAGGAAAHNFILLGVGQ